MIVNQTGGGSGESVEHFRWNGLVHSAYNSESNYMTVSIPFKADYILANVSTSSYAVFPLLDPVAFGKANIYWTDLSAGYNAYMKVNIGASETKVLMYNSSTYNNRYVSIEVLKFKEG